ncbi:hypothetical protein KDU71_07660 [Carboxylicivirga sediminis]|uniref:Uncharacterized protein n=1 Tax=Carboxylicivirga sediminis TaxID=2006564 RepID=A0A941F3T2_9BACT|nr:hypothetical protein [Carboxylicivirga sediminis]MBR8535433.1 hypothetical protein [Carboxylicivirga sediminis]
MKESLPDWKKKTASVVKQQFPTASTFVAGCNFEAMTKQYSHAPRKKLIATNTFSLRDLKVLYTEKTPAVLIESYLVYLNLHLNFKDEFKLSNSQIENLGRQLLTILGDITMGELWLFFDQVFTGYFDKFFGNIDPMTITRWARQYMSERGDVIMKDKALYQFIRDRNFKEDDKHHAEYNRQQFRKADEFKQMMELTERISKKT